MTVMYVDLYIIFSHYSVPTLDTSVLNLFNLIGKILYNLESILNRNVSENLTLISVYIKGNLLSHVMEESRGEIKLQARVIYQGLNVMSRIKFGHKPVSGPPFMELDPLYWC